MAYIDVLLLCVTWNQCLLVLRKVAPIANNMCQTYFETYVKTSKRTNKTLSSFSETNIAPQKTLSETVTIAYTQHINPIRLVHCWFIPICSIEIVALSAVMQYESKSQVTNDRIEVELTLIPAYERTPPPTSLTYYLYEFI